MAKTKTSSYIFLKGKLKKIITNLFGNKKYQKLVILGRQRTGSSLLMRLLHGHSEVDMQSEVFRLLQGKKCKTVWNETFSKKLPWIKYAGFKLFYNHPDDSNDREVWNLLQKDTKIKIIHIKRENILRTYISKLVAIKTGAWNSRQENEVLDKRVEVNIEHCLEELREIKRLEEEFGQSKFIHHDYMELTYEELTTNTEEQLKRIFNFLELKIEKSNTKKISLKKQNPESLKGLIINYNELKNALEDSEFAKFSKI